VVGPNADWPNADCPKTGTRANPEDDDAANPNGLKPPPAAVEDVGCPKTAVEGWPNMLLKDEAGAAGAGAEVSWPNREEPELSCCPNGVILAEVVAGTPNNEGAELVADVKAGPPNIAVP